MTHEEIDELEAGPELDAAVLRLVFPDRSRSMFPFRCPKCGCPFFWTPDFRDNSVACKEREEFTKGSCRWQGTWDDVAPPPFSTSIAAAWEVVDRFNSSFMDATEPSLGIDFLFFHNDCEVRGTATTVPLAICRAALKAVSK